MGSYERMALAGIDRDKRRSVYRSGVILPAGDLLESTEWPINFPGIILEMRASQNEILKETKRGGPTWVSHRPRRDSGGPYRRSS